MKYPSLQRAADAASGTAQRAFIALSVAQLALLAVIAFVSGWAPATADDQRSVAIVVFVLMLVTLAVTTALRLGHFDDRWFKCRAFAENVKSAAWFFVMSEPGSASAAEFLKEVDLVRDRLHQVVKDITAREEDGDLMTQEMRAAQGLSLQDKLKLFVRERLEDQRDWYRRKQKQNARREKQWFAAIFVVEFLALGYAALQAWKLWEFNAVGGIAATSAAFIAWLQTKRFSDLGETYSIAVGDLDRIAAEADRVDDEAKLKQFVQDVEKAVSREHSMWLARRVL